MRSILYLLLSYIHCKWPVGPLLKIDDDWLQTDGLTTKCSATFGAAFIQEEDGNKL